MSKKTVPAVKPSMREVFLYSGLAVVVFSVSLLAKYVFGLWQGLVDWVMTWKGGSSYVGGYFYFPDMRVLRANITDVEFDRVAIYISLGFDIVFLGVLVYLLLWKFGVVKPRSEWY